MHSSDDFTFCDQPHPGSDQEARDWHDRYHRNPKPRTQVCPGCNRPLSWSHPTCAHYPDCEA